LALALLRPVSKLFDSLHSGNLAALPLKSWNLNTVPTVYSTAVAGDSMATADDPAYRIRSILRGIFHQWPSYPLSQAALWSVDFQISDLVPILKKKRKIIYFYPRLPPFLLNFFYSAAINLTLNLFCRFSYEN
jgi:hypothetical protein